MRKETDLQHQIRKRLWGMTGCGGTLPGKCIDCGAYTYDIDKHRCETTRQKGE
jgi:hypothetical protein